jgi:hypothetical protein
MGKFHEQKALQKSKKVYTLTQEQIDKIRADAQEEAVSTAFTLLLAIPTEVLIGDDYWAKSAKRRIPKFLDEVIKLYKAWEGGTLTLEEMREDLWNFGGIKIEVDRSVRYF